MLVSILHKCVSRRSVLDVVDVPVIQPMLPCRKPFSHERPMFLFLNRNHKISAGQVIGGALLREPIGTASGDRHLFEGMQGER